MNIWYELIKIIFRVYRLLLIRRVKVSGWENLVVGPKIVVANHPNMTDPLVLPFIFPEQLTYLIQAETFSLPLIGYLLMRSGQIPVIRGQGRNALDEALVRLSKGDTVVIFPEGKLNHGKGLCRAGSGAAVLAKRSGAPILPIGFYVSPGDTLVLRGRIHKRKTFARWQVRGCCHVHIGKPWKVRTGSDLEVSKPKLREITKQMMTQIAALVQEAEYETETDYQPIDITPEIPQTTPRMGKYGQLMLHFVLYTTSFSG